MTKTKITGILLTLFAVASLHEASAQPITLTGTSYTNAFDTFEADSGPPLEWTTYTAATATAPGTIATWGNANIYAASNTWRLTSGRFANQASSYSYIGLTNFDGAESTAIQQAELNRCLAVRQVTATDKGVAFVLKIADTLNRKDFVLGVDFLNLDPTSTRTAVWTVDYGFGASPTLFVPVANFTNTAGAFTTIRTNISFVNDTIDNNAGPVWIRIVVLSNTTGSGNRQTTGLDNVSLTWAEGVAPCTPATITADPASVAGYINGNASFTVGAVGRAPLTYMWLKNSSTVLNDDGHFSGTATPTLSITTLQTGDAGAYSCLVSNVCDGTIYSDTSAGATLTVGAPPAVSIGYLRTLVDPTSWAPTNTSLLYTATGMITTLTNTTTANTASYYLQDGTGGINLFCTFGSTFRPQIGDVVTAVGPLGSFANNLELLVNLTDPAQGVTILSNNIAAYPAPIIVPWDNLYQYGTNADLNYNVAGSVVLLTNVHFGAWAGTVTTNGNYNMLVDNGSGLTARVYLPAALDNDLTNRTIPSLPCSVQGPLVATATGYQVMPTRWSDIVITVPTAASVTITSIVNNGNGTVTINYAGGAGTSFTLMKSSVLPNPTRDSWSPVGANNPTTPGSFTTTPAGDEFYTIRSN